MKYATLTLLSLFLGVLGTQAQNETDTTQIKLGTTKVVIINEEDSTEAISDTTAVDWDGEDFLSDDERREKLTFFAGLDLGMNLLVTKSGSTTMETGNEWLTLDYARSLSWRINVLEQKIPIYRDHVGILVGLGLTYNSYGLRNNVRVQSNTVANPDSIFAVAVPDSIANFSKNKLRATYLHVPLMLELNTSENPDKTFHLAMGVIGGVKIGSITKQEWSDNGDDITERRKQDFNIAPLTLDASARVGYRNFTIFASYGLTPLFKKGTGPEVYPVTVGLTVVPF
ncbi:MAG: hypothetical protein RLZZ77_2407 [Bacteroidota bacterium]